MCVVKLNNSNNNNNLYNNQNYVLNCNEFLSTIRNMIST